MTRHFGCYGRLCVVCQRRKPQAYWSAVATCGRACGQTVWHERRAANRPDHLRARLGIQSAREREIYRRAYAAGYARGKRLGQMGERRAAA